MKALNDWLWSLADVNALLFYIVVPVVYSPLLFVAWKLGMLLITRSTPPPVEEAEKDSSMD